MTETFVVDAPTIPLPAPWCWVWYTRHPRGMKRRRSITEYQAEKLKLQADLDAFARLYHRLDSQMRTRLYRTLAEDAADQGLAIAPHSRRRYAWKAVRAAAALPAAPKVAKTIVKTRRRPAS
jgi:hypothetical protein